MAVQLPAEVQGTAAGVLTWSFLCLTCSLFLLWLICSHSEKTSYVAMLSFFVSLNSLASVIQQIHTIVWWNDVKTEQYNYLVKNVGNPEIGIAGPSVGIDLALFYVQNYTYNVDALIVLFWAMELTRSVYQIRMLKQMGNYISVGTKCFAVMLPILQVGLLKTKAVQSSTAGFLFLTNIIIAISIVLCCSLLLAILFKYIKTRRAFMSWNVKYGKSGSSRDDMTSHGSNHNVHRLQTQSIYDRWLVVRFTIAFVALCIFQIFTIIFQIRSSNGNKRENIPPQVDLSASRAFTDFVLFLPGPAEGLMAFVVFGTTRTFRDHVFRMITPKAMWERRQARKMHKKKPSGAATEPQIHLRTENSSYSRRDYHDYHDAESGDHSPTDCYEEGIGLHDIDAKGMNGDRKQNDEMPILVTPALVRTRIVR